MATSQYFNNYSAKNEQRLIEDIIIESIKIMGFDAYYLPNDNDTARDLLFGEDPVKKFETAFPLEMYLTNATEYMGDQDFFSKFGLEIRDVIKVIVSNRSFHERVPNNISRPREGDLIYVPFLNGTGELYEIKFTEQAKDMHMLGRKNPYFYELSLEKFKYSQEVISTGIPDIDVVVTDSAYTLNLNLAAANGTGTYTSSEIVFQSADNTLANANTYATVQTWFVPSRLLTVTNIHGEFADNVMIIGASSNARFTLANFDPLQDPARKESYDNQVINTSASTIINNTEINPFGTI